MTKRQLPVVAPPLMLSAILAIAQTASAETATSTTALNLNASVAIAAGSYLDVIKSIEEDGYRVTEVKRTFLNRYRVLARNATEVREVIISSATGEVMRDAIIRSLVQRKDGDDTPSRRSTGTVSGRAGNTAGTTVGVGGGPVSAGGSASVGTSLGGESLGGSIGGSVGGGLGLGN